MWSFIKICLICVIVKNRPKEKFHRKTPFYVAVVKIWAHFDLKQQWTIEEISIFSNSSHLEWRVGLSDTNLKGTHPGTIPASLGLTWFSSFRGDDLNVKVYDVRRTSSDGKSSHGLWPSELKGTLKNNINICRTKISVTFLEKHFPFEIFKLILF